MTEQLTPAGAVALHLLPLLVEVDWFNKSTKNMRVVCRDPKKGDLVICRTSAMRQPHKYAIAFAETDYNSADGSCLLREIGGNDLCNMSNEMFYVIEMPIGNRLIAAYEESRGAGSEKTEHQKKG